MFRTCWLLALLLAVPGTQAVSRTVDDLNQVLPAELEGWKKSQEIASYTPETLSDYIDGGAELYLSFGFQRSLSVAYARGAGETITVDVFDQGSSWDAYGVFAHGRETPDGPIGQGSEYVSGQLSFWKDRFYVSIMATRETAETRTAVMKLGEIIAAAIEETGPLPPLVSLLPHDNLLPERVRYFHHYIWLNSFTFVSDENLLNINDDTPVAMGAYREAAGTYFLVIVQYPDETRAEKARNRFVAGYLNGKDRPVKVEDGHWSGCARSGPLIAAVLGAPDEQTVIKTLAKMRGKP
jgi:hypothetical protein